MLCYYTGKVDLQPKEKVRGKHAFFSELLMLFNVPLYSVTKLNIYQIIDFLHLTTTFLFF